MEISTKNLGVDVEFNILNESLSLEGGDSNAVLLPAKKGKKRKDMNQECGKVELNKKQKLSKAQKRKLKKLEAEKEKGLLLAKSIETLNKYQIPEYAFPLLQSSWNINRAETVMEKRRQAVHLLKEGLVVPHNDKLSKRMDASQKFETKTEEILLEQEIEEETIQTITGREVLNKASDPLEYSHGPVCGNEIANNSESCWCLYNINTISGSKRRSNYLQPLLGSSC